MQPATSQQHILSPSLEGAQVHRTAWLAVGALVFALVGPWLLSKGMFWDGVVYGTIARNLTIGVGDAWHPIVTSTFMTHFHEHPPLGFWLQAAYFQVLGDHFWVERIYSLSTLLVTLWLLDRVWRLLLADAPVAARCGWFAIALWAPWGTWCYRHNMLENTLSVFTTLTVYAVLRAFGSLERALAWSTLAGVSLAAAAMVKGPIALFPAITPVVALLSLHPQRVARAAGIQLAMLVALVASLSAVLCWPAAREYLGAYLDEQLLSSLRGERERAGSWLGQFNVIVCVLRELRTPVALAGLLVLLARKVPRSGGAFARGGPFWFCLLTACSASLPIIVSPKQGGHYTAPSWPYFSFAVALAALPSAIALLQRFAGFAEVHRRAIRGCTAVAWVGIAALAVANYGKPLRDQAVIAASDQLGTQIASGTIAVPGGKWSELSTGDQLKLHVYLYRNYSVSLFVDEAQPAFNLACHRLERPDAALVVGPQRIATHSGVSCRLLVDPAHPLVTTATTAERAKVTR